MQATYPDIDLVYIGTSPSVHAEQALLAIAAGKPVLVEKPFALSANQAAQVFQSAREAEVHVFEAMHSLHHSLFSRILELVGSGVIGTIRHLDADFSVPIADEGHEFDGRPDSAAGPSWLWKSSTNTGATGVSASTALFTEARARPPAASALAPVSIRRVRFIALHPIVGIAVTVTAGEPNVGTAQGATIGSPEACSPMGASGMVKFLGSHGLVRQSERKSYAGLLRIVKSSSTGC